MNRYCSVFFSLVFSMLNLHCYDLQVIEELRRFNGDVTQATAALFAKSLKF